MSLPKAFFFEADGRDSRHMEPIWRSYAARDGRRKVGSPFVPHRAKVICQEKGGTTRNRVVGMPDRYRVVGVPDTPKTTMYGITLIYVQIPAIHPSLRLYIQYG
jgi:hypothetical protein